MSSHDHPESFRFESEAGLVLLGRFDTDDVGSVEIIDGPALVAVTTQQVPEAIFALAAFADCDVTLSGGSWRSGNWPPGRLVEAVGGWIDASGEPAEYLVDDCQWESGMPCTEQDVLAELDRVSWDLGPGGGGSPGNSDNGRYYLVKLGTRYAVFSFSGGERGDGGDISAATDAEAIRVFRAGYGDEGMP